MPVTIAEERLSVEEYLTFLRESDLGSQYPQERFLSRIDTLLRRASLSLVAREEGRIVGVCLGITDFAYWLFVTDLGVVRSHTGQGIGKALLRRIHDLAGGDENIILYTCANENAVGFYAKQGMTRADDVMVRNHMPWTEFTVE